MLDAELFIPEFVETVLCLYLTGMPIFDISNFVGLSPNEVNRIIDRYAPYL